MVDTVSQHADARAAGKWDHGFCAPFVGRQEFPRLAVVVGRDAFGTQDPADIETRDPNRFRGGSRFELSVTLLQCRADCLPTHSRECSGVHRRTGLCPPLPYHPNHEDHRSAHVREDPLRRGEGRPPRRLPRRTTPRRYRTPCAGLCHPGPRRLRASRGRTCRIARETV